MGRTNEIYFVSYGYSYDDKVAYGNAEVGIDEAITRFEELQEIERYLERHLKLPYESIKIFNYVHLRTEVVEG